MRSPASPTFDEGRLESIFAGIEADGPGLAVGVAHRGRPLFRRGFGLAHAELSCAVTPETRMRIGSSTKQFTALAIMLLHETGLLDLDDRAGRHLPELNSTNGSATIRQLMTNSSGLADAFSYKLELAGIDTRPIPSDELLALYRRITHRNAPAGRSWRYNNGGWLILGSIVERLSGRPLEDFLSERIFKPIGMTDSLLRRWDHDVVPSSATAHVRLPDGRFIKADYGMDNFAAAGAIVSTIDDMLRWLAHMDAPTVGSPGSWQEILTPLTLPNGVSTGYGFGIFRNHYRGVEVIHHAGGGCGCNAQILKLPAAALDIVVMANRDDISSAAVVRSIINTLLPSLDAADATDAAPIAKGVFRSPETGRVVHLHEKAGSAVACFGGVDYGLVQTPEGWLELGEGSRYLQRKLQIEEVESGRSVLRLDDFGYLDVLLDEDSPPPPSSTIIGQYRNVEADIVTHIRAIDAGYDMLSCTPMGQAHFTIAHLGGAIFRARSTALRDEYGGILDFSANDGGFTYSTAYLDQVQFAKFGNRDSQ